MQINWLNLLTGGSAVVLVGVDAALLTEAAAWAVSGLAGLAPQIATALYLLGAVAALTATVAFARLVHSVEPFFERRPIRIAPDDGTPARNERRH